MGNTVRVTTKNHVYSIGQNLPVPEGYPLEPFLIATIDHDEETIRFTCVPDESAAQQVTPELIKKFEDNKEEVSSEELYQLQARQAVENRWMIWAFLDRHDDSTRIEEMITVDEYNEIIKEEQKADRDDVEVEEDIFDDEEPAEEKKNDLPAEVSVVAP